jgi:hypothetical protein
MRHIVHLQTCEAKEHEDERRTCENSEIVAAEAQSGKEELPTMAPPKVGAPSQTT